MNITVCQGTFGRCLTLAAAICSIWIPASGPSTGLDVKSKQATTQFERDQRLEVRISIASKTDWSLRIWGALTGKTGVRIECDDAAAEIADGTLAVGLRSVSARSIMDAMAALFGAKWSYTQRKTYILLVGNREMLETFAPKGEREIERFTAGKPFLHSLESMSPEQKSALESGRSVPFNSLPQDMQSSVSAMLGSLAQEYREKGKGDTVSVDALSQAAFRLDRKPAAGFNRLFLTVKVPGVGSTGWRLNDYEDQLKAREQARTSRRAGELENEYDAKRFELSHEEAKCLPEFQRKVELDIRDSTFPRVLQKLNEDYRLPFVSDPEQLMPQRADVMITSTTLGDALDRLAAIYKDTEWEWRRMGVLVIRGPTNPNRRSTSTP